MSTMRIRAQAIKELEDKLGRVTAEQLVDVARRKTHPLHDDFPWDDRKAAHKYRLDIAREIIVSVRTVVVTSQLRIPCVSYVRDPNAPSNKQGYVAVTQLRTDREAAMDTILAEVARVQSMLERAKELATVLDLQGEFAAALDAAAMLAARLRKGIGVDSEAVQ